VRERGREAFRPIGRDGAHEHHPIRVEERRLENRVLEARRRQARPIEGLEPEIGHEAATPFRESGARPLFDEKALLPVQ